MPDNIVILDRSSFTITFGWDDNSSDEDGFSIKWGNGDGVYVFLSSVTTPNTTTYIDTGLEVHTSHYYKVRAYNSAGQSDYCAGVGTITLNAPEYYPVTAPSGLALVATSSFNVQMSWTDNSDNESGFKIHRSHIDSESSRTIDISC